MVNDDWSAGFAGVYRGKAGSVVHRWDTGSVGVSPANRDNNADGDFDDAGDEILISDDFNSAAITLSYDDNGNLTADGIFAYDYDAWNRLRLAKLVVGSDETTIGDYEYYGDVRRAKKTVTNVGPENTLNDGGDTTVVFYYGGVRPSRSTFSRWNIFETRNGSNQTTMAFLPGTQYTDEHLGFEVNGDPSASNDTNPDNTAAGESGESPVDARYAFSQGRNWDVTAITDSAGAVAEHYTSYAYGDSIVLQGNPGNGALGNVATMSTTGNPQAHHGLPIDMEPCTYHNRSRSYSAPVSRFSQRDPLAIRMISVAVRSLPGGLLRGMPPDGPNPYQYARNNHLTHVDPTGLFCTPCVCPPSSPPQKSG